MIIYDYILYPFVILAKEDRSDTSVLAQIQFRSHFNIKRFTRHLSSYLNQLKFLQFANTQKDTFALQRGQKCLIRASMANAILYCNPATQVAHFNIGKLPSIFLKLNTAINPTQVSCHVVQLPFQHPSAPFLFNMLNRDKSNISTMCSLFLSSISTTHSNVTQQKWQGMQRISRVGVLYQLLQIIMKTYLLNSDYEKEVSSCNLGSCHCQKTKSVHMHTFASKILSVVSICWIRRESADNFQNRKQFGHENTPVGHLHI